MQCKIEHDSKQNICNFFIVPVNGQASLGMPDIELSNSLTKSCNTIGINETDTADSCSRNTAISQGRGC